MGKIKFDPQKYRPVPNNGHPDLNVDSVAYQEYWSKEMDRCINGFKPKGMKKISGKYLSASKIMRFKNKKLENIKQN